MPEAKDYKNLTFTDRAVANLPSEVRDLAKMKFVQLDLLDLDFNPDHTAACHAQEETGRQKGMRYYEIQIESSMADKIMAAGTDGRFGHFLGSSPADGYCEIRPAENHPNPDGPAPR